MKKIIFAVSIVLLVCCVKAKKEKKEEISKTAILFSNVNIIDVRNGTIMKLKQVVVDSGKIQQIVDTIENPLGYTTLINGEEKFLLPGLAEMHAHIPQPPTSDERIEETLFLYLSRGITTIRGMLGHPTHLTLREKALTGDILSPRIFTSSPSLNGTSITTPEEAIEKVTAYKNEGYDFLKMHPGIKREVFDQAIKTANALGIPYAGHVPVDVGIKHALESKYASIDHVDGFLEGLVPETKNVDPTKNGFFGYAFTPLADTTNIDGLVQLAKDNKVWIVATQSLFERWFAPISADSLLKQPGMKYMPKTTLENWKLRKNESTLDNPDFNEAQWQEFDAIRKQLIKKLQENGHGMLLGSDAPQLFNVPGFSIMHEMQGLLNAGLTPLQIIQSGTINPALYFDKEDSFGQIKEGMDADMILLQKNPLINLDALKHISGVMVRGKWLSKDSIEKKLVKIAENAATN